MSKIWFPRFASSVADHFQARHHRLPTARIQSARVVLPGLILTAMMLGLIAPSDVQGQSTLSLKRVATGLNLPTFATSAPGDTSRLFITEKNGNIRILNLADNSLLATPFLTQSQLSAGGVGFTEDGERGLLGLAFDPNYQTNRRFYVNYTDGSGRTRVRSFQSQTGNANLADGNSAANILQIDQPQNNHNGGWLAFGPDNQLYIATGDGGGGNDPGNNSLDRSKLLGKMLRITPTPGAAQPYLIPAGNPFVNDGDPNTLGEIWAYGLRNPWRNSFDRLTGDLYIADVGQVAREEINFQASNSVGGQNYGWRIREGKIGTSNNDGGLVGYAAPTDPIYDYLRGFNAFQGNSVTGGYVYRGHDQELQGLYFFGDFSSSRLFSFQYDGTTLSNLKDWNSSLSLDAGSLGNITSFGEDGNGNLYLMNSGGSVYLFSPVPEPGVVGFCALVGGLLVCQRRRRNRV